MLFSEPGKTVLEKFSVATLILLYLSRAETSLGSCVQSSGSSCSPSSLYSNELSVLLFCVCSWLPYCIPQAQNLQQTPLLAAQKVAMKAEEHTAWRIFHLHLGEGQAKQTNRVLNTVSCLSFFSNVFSPSLVSGQAAQTCSESEQEFGGVYSDSCSSWCL